MAKREITIPAFFSPSGTTARAVTVTFQLVGFQHESVFGFHAGDGITAPEAFAVNGEAYDIEIPMNDDITPEDTRWKITIQAGAESFGPYYREISAAVVDPENPTAPVLPLTLDELILG